MRALLWKEWREVGPAHFLVALVIAGPLLVALPPEKVLLPSELDVVQICLVWTLVAIVEGFLMGLLHHARDRGRGTEAFLMHRASGPRRAFAGRALCGTAAISLALSGPPLAYFLVHVVIWPVVEHPLTERLAYLLAVGACGVPAYALGAFIAQLRGRWWSRVLLGIAGCLSLLFAAAVASQAPAVGGGWPILRYLAVQFVLAGALLMGASCLNRAGDDASRPWPRRPGLVAGGFLLALTLLPWAFFVAQGQTICRINLLGSYPQVVEDAGGILYLARRLPPIESEGRSWSPPRFELQDAKGRTLADDRVQRYEGFGWDFDPFLTIFDAGSTPLVSSAQLQVELTGFESAMPFGFDGAWMELRAADEWRNSLWFHVSDGTVHHLHIDTGQELRPRARHEVLTRPDTNKGFSRRTSVAFAWNRPTTSGTRPLLIDLDDRSLWSFDASADKTQIERVELPDHDQLVRLQRARSLDRARTGLFGEQWSRDPVLVEGHAGWYLWNGQGFETVVDRAQLARDFHRHVVPESEANEFLAWRLEPSRADGLGFHLDVIDVKTDQVVLSHDFQPESEKQRILASVTWLTSLLRPPAGSLWSYFGAHVDPRDVRRPIISYRYDNLLLGSNHPLLLCASVALGALLAISSRRRLGRAPRDRAVRNLWTLAVAAFGVPAWLLCRLLEPSRKELIARSQPSGALSSLLIESPRSAPALKPALSGV